VVTNHPAANFFFLFLLWGKKRKEKRTLPLALLLEIVIKPHPKNEACSHIKNLQVYQLKIELAPVTITLQLTNLFEQKQK
jgi:hypothetical protein